MTSERLRRVLGRYKYTAEYIAVVVTVILALQILVMVGER